MYIDVLLEKVKTKNENENCTVFIPKGIHNVASREASKGLGLKSHPKTVTGN